MATHIVANSPILVNYLIALGLELSKPQFRHFVNLVDALILREGRKTVCRLTRKLLKGRTVFSVCDFFGLTESARIAHGLPLPCGSRSRPSCYVGLCN
ncbi:MAG: hypothetical protein GW893_11140 [Armatimonadetes bacterium]|nr:hypothetical protein [Armatimonadota bacterium]